MKIISQEQNWYLLRLEKGEELMQTVASFAHQSNLPGAFFHGIGATSAVTIGRYNLGKKAYEFKDFSGDLELVNITGDISWLGEEVVVHAHASVSNENLQVFGGHVKELVVSATCELSLRVSSKKLEREKEEEIGLNLLQGI